MRTIRNNNIADILTLSNVTLSFRKVTLNDIDYLNTYFIKHPSMSCDYSVGGILMWRDLYDYEICFYNNSLFLRGNVDNKYIYYIPPFVDDIKEYLEIIKSSCMENSFPTYILKQSITDVSENNVYVEENELAAGWREYVYDIHKFISFPGKKMEKKRNHLNFFNKHYPNHSVEIIDSSNIAEIVSFTMLFRANHEAHQDQTLFEYECDSVVEALLNYERFPFFGILIRNEGRIIGYSFGEKIGETFIVHAEKGDIEYHGIYQAIASNMATAAIDKYPEILYINREDDMGDEHLRRSKLSYHPTHFIEKQLCEL